MRLGYNTNGFGSHRLGDALEVIAGLGYRSVALTLDAGALDPWDPATPARAREVAAWISDRDLLPVVETGARFLLDPWRKHWPTLLSREPRDRERRRDFLRRAIDLAATLGAPVVSLWSGSPDAPGEDPAALDDRLAEGLQTLADHARGCGVIIGFEPEPGMYLEDMAGWTRIRDRVGHEALRLTLDVGHAHITEGDAPATIARHAGEVVNVHLEGMSRDRHDHLLPGEGDLDLAAVVEALRAAGYAGPANLELSRHSHMAVDAARRSLEFFRPLGLP